MTKILFLISGRNRKFSIYSREKYESPCYQHVSDISWHITNLSYQNEYFHGLESVECLSPKVRENIRASMKE